MKRFYLLLMIVVMALSTISTTCEESLLMIEVSVVNKSSESVKCIVLGNHPYADGELILFSPNDSGGYSPLTTIECGDTIVEKISIHPDDNWDQTYSTFIFFDKKDIIGDNDRAISGVSKCYTLTELKKMDWTVIYKDNEK